MSLAMMLLLTMLGLFNPLPPTTRPVVAPVATPIQFDGGGGPVGHCPASDPLCAPGGGG